MSDWCRNAQLLSQPTSTQTLGWWSLPVFLLGFPLWLLTAGCSSFLPVLVTTRKDVWFVTLNWRWKVSEWSLVRRMSGISEIRNITLRSTEYNEDYNRNILFFFEIKDLSFLFFARENCRSNWTLACLVDIISSSVCVSFNTEEKKQSLICAQPRVFSFIFT